jgi:hypothetical protein
LVIYECGEVLDKVMHDPTRREHSDRSADIIDNWKVSIAALLHPPDRCSNRVFRIYSDRVGSHATPHGGIERTATSENAGEQVSFGEDPDHPATIRDQQAADVILSHCCYGIGDCGFGIDCARGCRVKPGDAIYTDVPRQLHWVEAETGQIETGLRATA